MSETSSSNTWSRSLNTSSFSSQMLIKYCNSSGCALKHGVRKNFLRPQFQRAFMHASFFMAISSSSPCSLSFHSITIVAVYLHQHGHKNLIRSLQHSEIHLIGSHFDKLRRKFELRHWHDYFVNIRANWCDPFAKRSQLARVCARYLRELAEP